VLFLRFNLSNLDTEELYNLDTNWRMFIEGVITLIMTALWPVPDLVDGSKGPLVGVLRLIFATGGLMFLGPATKGWATLGAVVVMTGFYLTQESGLLRTASAMYDFACSHKTLTRVRA